MSAKKGVWSFVRAVLASDDLTPTEKLTAVALASAADYTTGKNVRPGPAHLRALTGLSDSSVRRARASLEAKGWIVREHSGGIVNGRRLTNSYTLNCGHGDRGQSDREVPVGTTAVTVTDDCGHSDLPPPSDLLLTTAPTVHIEDARRRLRGEVSA